MEKEFTKKVNPLVDYIEPVFIDNFLNNRSSICRELLSEAASFLKEHGWENDFAMYYHEKKEIVRLYLRIAYVGAFIVDGTWEGIKKNLPTMIPLIKALIELRKYKNIDLKWIEKNCKYLEWANINNQCISCETFLNSTRGLK